MRSFARKVRWYIHEVSTIGHCDRFVSGEKSIRARLSAALDRFLYVMPGDDAGEQPSRRALRVSTRTSAAPGHRHRVRSKLPARHSATSRSVHSDEALSFRARCRGMPSENRGSRGAVDLNATLFAIVGTAGRMTIRGGTMRGAQSEWLQLLIDGILRRFDKGLIASMPNATANVDGVYAMLARRHSE